MHNNSSSSEVTTTAKTIVLYDGVCGLCNRLTQFLLKRDRHNRLNFASLQSDFSSKLLKRYGYDPQDLDTVYVVVDPSTPTERVLARSDAILYLAGEIGGIWRLFGAGTLLPKYLRDRLYDLVAKNRYRVFGKHETCMLPEPQHRKKFIEV